MRFKFDDDMSKPYIYFYYTVGLLALLIPKSTAGRVIDTFMQFSMRRWVSVAIRFLF